MNKPAFALTRRILAVAFTILLVVSTSIMPQVSAKSLSQLQQEYDKAQAQIEANQNKIQNNESQKLKNEEKMKILSEQAEAIGEQLKIIENQMTVLSKDISKIDAEIEKLNKKIDNTNEKIESAKKEIEDTKDLIAKRLSASYMAGDTSWLEMLLEADSLSSLLLRLELVTNVTKSDNALIDHLDEQTKKLEKLEKELAADKKVFEEKKANVQAKKDELEKQKKDLVKKQDQFNENYLEYSRIIAQLDRNSEIYKSEIRKNQLKKQEFEREIDRLVSQGSQGGDSSQDNYYNDGVMMWPVPYSNSYISAGYGYYDPDGDGILDFHPAIDIVVRENGKNVSYGKKIVAAQSGKVIARGYSNVGGNYVTIDHGDGFRTYYGHCSAVHVSQGAVVKKGQHIADIGATGYVTGPHVHFQVMRVVNGKVEKLNPINFVTPPNQ